MAVTGVESLESLVVPAMSYRLGRHSVHCALVAVGRWLTCSGLPIDVLWRYSRQVARMPQAGEGNAGDT